MRITLGRKLGAVIVLPALLAAALSAFAWVEGKVERSRDAQIEQLSARSAVTNELFEAVQDTVIAADAVSFETDRKSVGQKIEALNERLAHLARSKAAFLKAIAHDFPPERLTHIALRIDEFSNYQTDTAQLGLTVSPQAAQIQANDPATVESRREAIDLLRSIDRDLIERIKVEQSAIETLQGRTDTMLVAVPCLTILIGLGLAASVVRSQISQPLEALESCMGALAKGDIGTTVPLTQKQDEMGEMARAIVVFRDALVANQKNANETQTRALTDASRADRVVEMSRAFETQALEMMRGLSRSVAGMDDAAHEVARASDQTLAETKTVWSAAQETTTILAPVSTAAIELSSAASQIADRIGATHAGTRQALDEADVGEARMTQLVVAAREIEGATKLIDAIARQTNLLALNATIEAARAGDSGRGFAIVAGEVKTLAAQTADATTEIQGRVAMIQEASMVTAKAIGTVRDTLHQVNAIAADLASAALEQGAASEGIAKALVEIMDRARIVSESVGAVNTSAIANGSRADELRRKASDHGEHASRLNAVISSFVTDMRKIA